MIRQLTRTLAIAASVLVVFSTSSFASSSFASSTFASSSPAVPRHAAHIAMSVSQRVSAASTVKPKSSPTSTVLPASSEPSDPMNAFRIPKGTRQIIVGITSGWAGNKAELRRFTRKSGAWATLDNEPIAAVLGPNGLAWGRGLHPTPVNAISAAGGSGAKRTKREGDKRSPAGVFSLGKAYGYDPLWAARTKLDYVTVTPADLFIEDPSSEFYNKQIRLDRPAATDWELSQQMEQTDPAHRLEVVVGHNTPEPVRGAGSAILLHIWRQNGKKFTTGCTAMADADIETILRWLDPAAQPLYVLLPRSEYLARQVAWGLPAIDSAAATPTSSGE
jgi:L,D-peptidoglycan transpeptidase YkuD (ErfK/YbiS/YcfS/YnhG family)